MKTITGDPRGVARAEEQLAISEHLLARSQEYIGALREIRSQNNVTALARHIRDASRERGD
jgi:hypothetical protein